MTNLWASNPAAWDLVLTVLIKLGIGSVLGALIGWERELHGRPAGIRTHMLVVIGVVLYTEVSKGFANGDPSRVAAQIVTGIGFLGAGTILRNGTEIKGLTTAASIWAVAGIGMAVSMGGPYMVIAVIATVLTLITLTVVDEIELKLMPEAHPSELILALQSRSDVVAVLEALGKEGLKISRTEMLKTEPTVEILLHVSGDRERILRTACSLPGVLNATWSR
jgi:putative Mg2+ transporter-C (MgtC) family protein